MRFLNTQQPIVYTCTHKFVLILVIGRDKRPRIGGVIVEGLKLLIKLEQAGPHTSCSAFCLRVRISSISVERKKVRAKVISNPYMYTGSLFSLTLT